MIYAPPRRITGWAAPPPVTLPPASANGSARQPPAPPVPKPGRLHTRISGLRTGLIAASQSSP
jgi:hypothetical protein